MTVEMTGTMGAMLPGLEVDRGATPEAVGQAVEEMFVQMLMKQMQQGLSEGAGAYSDAFSGMLTKELAASGQLGLADQITEMLGGTAPGTIKPTWNQPVGSGERVWPLRGRLTSDFGMRTHPITGKYTHHDGIDIAAPTGTPIRAAKSGVVKFSGDRGGYGNLVIVEHSDGTQTRYGHCHRLNVRPGERVRAGQEIATVGSTGRSTGPHLHFEVRVDGKPVDPGPWLRVAR